MIDMGLLPFDDRMINHEHNNRADVRRTTLSLRLPRDERPLTCNGGAT